MQFSGLRFTNILLLVFVLVLTLTGLYGLFFTIDGWMFTIHRASGWGLIALLPWKAAISIRSLRRGLRPNINRGLMIGVSLFLSLLTFTVLALALLWKGRFGPQDYWLRQTAISWHWMLALGLLAPFAVHVWQRWPGARRVDFTSRRAVLRIAALGLLGGAGYATAQVVGRQREQAARRFTGSRLAAAYTGNRFPVTHTVPARPEQIDPRTWRLRVFEGAHSLDLSYADLLALPTREIEATIDCTLGWYAQQHWLGVPLVDLLEKAGIQQPPLGVRLESVTGYAHLLPYQEAKDILVATHVESETLDASHGFPARAVIPSRRGWFWVKWLTKIEPVDFLPPES